MKIIVLMHVESEGLGTLRDFLDSIHVNLEYVRLYAGAHIPQNVHDIDAIVSMGGPMNVYEEDKYSFLREETEFLREAIDADVPVLGICLGAQMIAKACGCSVHKAPTKELGWSNVQLTEVGRNDILFKGLPPILQVFQWHEDMFELPPGGFFLATSEECPHQAFRYRNAYGLQFHIEVTGDMLLEWCEGLPEQREFAQKFDAIKSDFLYQANRIYANFCSLVEKNSLL